MRAVLAIALLVGAAPAWADGVPWTETSRCVRELDGAASGAEMKSLRYWHFTPRLASDFTNELYFYEGKQTVLLFEEDGYGIAVPNLDLQIMSEAAKQRKQTMYLVINAWNYVDRDTNASCFHLEFTSAGAMRVTRAVRHGKGSECPTEVDPYLPRSVRSYALRENAGFNRLREGLENFAETEVSRLISLVGGKCRELKDGCVDGGTPGVRLTLQDILPELRAHVAAADRVTAKLRGPVCQSAALSVATRKKLAAQANRLEQAIATLEDDYWGMVLKCLPMSIDVFTNKRAHCPH